MSSAARRAVDRYVEAVNARDLDAMESLFAAHAVLLPPQAEPLEGVEAILGYYRDLVFAFAPSVSAVNHVAEGDTCVVELEATLGDSLFRFADLFTVESEGGERVARLAIYQR